MKLLKRLVSLVFTAVLMVALTITSFAIMYPYGETAMPYHYIVFKENIYESYFINGYNYFGLRDMAYLLNEAGKPIEIAWDDDVHAIKIITGKAYTVTGGELDQGNGAVKRAIWNSAPIYLGDKKLSVNSYIIDGKCYMRIGDMGNYLNFGVVQSGNRIKVDSALKYKADKASTFESYKKPNVNSCGQINIDAQTNYNSEDNPLYKDTSEQFKGCTFGYYPDKYLSITEGSEYFQNLPVDEYTLVMVDSRYMDKVTMSYYTAILALNNDMDSDGFCTALCEDGSTYRVRELFVGDMLRVYRSYPLPGHTGEPTVSCNGDNKKPEPGWLQAN